MTQGSAPMTLDAKTQLCGVIGNPVEHSLSPAIHNAAFQVLGLNYVYLAFPVDDIAGAMQGLRGLGNFRGVSVTIPHKLAVLPYLDEVEPTAQRIGAVNTIVVEGKKLTGYNTDASGAIQALQDGGAPLSRGRILLVGSGGAARAVAFGLCAGSLCPELTILGIDKMERQVLVRDLQEKTVVRVQEGDVSPDRLHAAVKEAQVLIHCSPIGMYPKVGDTVVPREALHSGLTVMDIVYNPLETRLLREAKQAGCHTIRGVDMFLRQAVRQFELWTGTAAPAEVMREILEIQFSSALLEDQGALPERMREILPTTSEKSIPTSEGCE